MAHSSDRTLLASLGFADPDKKDRRHTLACQYLAQPSILQKVVATFGVPMLPRFEMDEANAARITDAPVPPPDVAEHPTLTYSMKRGRFLELYGYVVKHGKVEVPITRRGGYLVGFWDVVASASWFYPYATVTDTYDKERARPSAGWNFVDWKPNMTAAEQAKYDAGRREQERMDAQYRLALAEWEALPFRFVSRSFKDSGWSQTAGTIRIEVKARPVDVADIARQIALYLSDNPPSENDLTIVATCYPMSVLDKETLKRKGIHHIRLGAPFEEWCKQQEQAVADGEGF